MAFPIFNRVLVSLKDAKHRVNLLLCTEYALKSDLPIKWVRPEHIPCYKPGKSGDLDSLPKVDTSQTAPDFKGSRELYGADENVKKLFSLEFQPYKQTVKLLREEYLKKVRRHNFDVESPEARLGKMTADIRDMQVYMEEHPKNKRTKVRLKETIDKRKKLLKQLRSWDYKCFEYIIEKLGLVYKPFPGQDVWKRIERKRSLRMLTSKHCDRIVKSKLSEYKTQLELQQEDFLVNKIKTLKWIQEQEAFCGVSSTVSDVDIKETEYKLEKLRKEKEIIKDVIND